MRCWLRTFNIEIIYAGCKITSHLPSHSISNFHGTCMRVPNNDEETIFYNEITIIATLMLAVANIEVSEHVH